MQLYGLVIFADETTNMTDKVIIQCCNHSKKDCFCTENCTIYVFDKMSCKLLDRSLNESAYLSYTGAVELLAEALLFDKKHDDVICAEFVYDTDKSDKPVFRVARIEKNIFPLPRKNITYLPCRTYINITSHISGSDLLSVQEASVYAAHLNNIAVYNGYVSDNFFEHSCGRVLMMADCLMSDAMGRNFIKLVCNDLYKLIRSVVTKSVRCGKTPGYNCKADFFDNDNYSNNFLKVHNIISKRLCHEDLFDVLYNPQSIRELISKEMQVFEYEYERDYYKTLVSNIRDYSYISYEHLLLMHVDAEFRMNIHKLVSNQRKIYNANKSRADFVAIVSDGRMICR